MPPAIQGLSMRLKTEMPAAGGLPRATTVLPFLASILWLATFALGALVGALVEAWL
jgi:hypothetical protein